MQLKRNKKYLQVALNKSLSEAKSIIRSLPYDERILIEAGTPLIKKEGISVVGFLRNLWQEKGIYHNSSVKPYIVADLKTADLASWEVLMAKNAGASSAVCLGVSPIETINSFIAHCKKYKIDSMVDMMNVESPVSILSNLERIPDVVILHRGVDEETLNKEKELPFYDIQIIKNQFDVSIAIAGGDEFTEVQRAILNDADIVVVWKDFYSSSANTGKLAEEFLKEIR